MKKIIATGKGGVGKTTTLTTVSLLMAREGKKVIVFDTDPSMNLALSFGIPYDSVSTITEDKHDINSNLEDHGITESGQEILEEHSVVTEDGIRIVIMGAIQHGGDGCLCSAISVIKILLDYVEQTGEYDIAIVDSQAGPEILGRGLAASFDCNVVLSEPTAKSSEVSRQVKKLADDLGVKDTVLIVNKADSESDVSFTAQMVGIEPYKATGVMYDRDVVMADKENKLLVDAYPDSSALANLKKAKSMIEASIGW
jgi:CO dehydrogenase maturation factor